MNKPGSHRGANNTKKKQYTRGELKKEAIPLMDKIKTYIDEQKVLHENNKYHFRVSCYDLAKKFKCRLGEVVVCVNRLHQEKLVSSISKRFMTFYINTERKQEETIIIDSIIFNDETCPLCGNKLEISQYETGGFFQSKCRFNCFEYSFSVSGGHKAKIFNKEFNLKGYFNHNSFKGQFINDVNKEIKRMKRNNRYLAEILSR